jgi:hypothetical protein
MFKNMSRKEACKMRKARAYPFFTIPEGIVDILFQNSPSREVDITDYRSSYQNVQWVEIDLKTVVHYSLYFILCFTLVDMTFV